jgi:hypothetical protein
MADAISTAMGTPKSISTAAGHVTAPQIKDLIAGDQYEAQKAAVGVNRLSGMRKTRLRLSGPIGCRRDDDGGAF